MRRILVVFADAIGPRHGLRGDFRHLVHLPRHTCADYRPGGAFCVCAFGVCAFGVGFFEHISISLYTVRLFKHIYLFTY